jgi:hypothetical protein
MVNPQIANPQISLVCQSATQTRKYFAIEDSEDETPLFQGSAIS